MNALDAFNITRPLCAQPCSIVECRPDYEMAERAICDAITARWPAPLERVGIAIGTGKAEFERSRDLRLAIGAARRVMLEVN